MKKINNIIRAKNGFKDQLILTFQTDNISGSSF